MGELSVACTEWIFSVWPSRTILRSGSPVLGWFYGWKHEEAGWYLVLVCLWYPLERYYSLLSTNPQSCVSDVVGIVQVIQHDWLLYTEEDLALLLVWNHFVRHRESFSSPISCRDHGVQTSNRVTPLPGCELLMVPGAISIVYLELCVCPRG